MFDPLESDITDEFVEVFNIGATGIVDLAGWKIGDGISEDILTDAGEGLLLKAGGYALFIDGDYQEGPRPYDAMIPDESLIVMLDGTTFGSGGWSNAKSETIFLLDSDGRCVARYSTTPGNESGHSDEKIDLDGSDNVDNWLDSRTLHGTPGYANSVAYDPSRINVELVCVPNPFSPDNDGWEDETTVSYSFPERDVNVSLRVFDAQGRRFRTLLSGWESGSSGSVVWDGKDDQGRSGSIGVYVVYIEGLAEMQGKVFTKKTAVVLAGRL
jgi:hypothetical protein